MKKILLVFYIVLSFCFCLVTSYIVKKSLNIEGDYLSAFTTLLAAVVAYNLYSDWKEQHKLKLWEKYISDSRKILSDLKDCQKSIGEFQIAFLASTSTKVPYDSELRQYKIKLRDTILRSQNFLFEYNMFLKTIKGRIRLVDHIVQVDELRALSARVLMDLIEINKAFTSVDSLDRLIESLFSGNLAGFVTNFQIFTDVSVPKYYFEFFEVVE